MEVHPCTFKCVGRTCLARVAVGYGRTNEFERTVSRRASCVGIRKSSRAMWASACVGKATYIGKVVIRGKSRVAQSKKVLRWLQNERILRDV